jgi:hypothetical protein
VNSRILAPLTCLVLIAVPVVAQADDDRTFDNGVVHFEVADTVLVESTTVGTVDVIVARTASARSGAVDSHSFVSVSIFRENACDPEGCRERILDGLQTTLEGAQVRPSELPDDPSEPLTMRIAHSGAVAEGELRAFDAGSGTVVVTYAQFDTSENTPELATLLASIELGPAPETDDSTEEH